MHVTMHPFLVVTRFGELITVNRLSCVKHIINKFTNQEKNAIYRVFLRLIELFNCN